VYMQPIALALPLQCLVYSTLHPMSSRHRMKRFFALTTRHWSICQDRQKARQLCRHQVHGLCPELHVCVHNSVTELIIARGIGESGYTYEVCFCIDIVMVLLMVLISQRWLRKRRIGRPFVHMASPLIPPSLLMASIHLITEVSMQHK
jgi:hypothetical protein